LSLCVIGFIIEIGGKEGWPSKPVSPPILKAIGLWGLICLGRKNWLEKVVWSGGTGGTSLLVPILPWESKLIMNLRKPNFSKLLICSRCRYDFNCRILLLCLNFIFSILCIKFSILANLERSSLIGIRIDSKMMAMCRKQLKMTRKLRINLASVNLWKGLRKWISRLSRFLKKWAKLLLEKNSRKCSMLSLSVLLAEPVLRKIISIIWSIKTVWFSVKKLSNYVDLAILRIWIRNVESYWIPICWILRLKRVSNIWRRIDLTIIGSPNEWHLFYYVIYLNKCIFLIRKISGYIVLNIKIIYFWYLLIKTTFLLSPGPLFSCRSPRRCEGLFTGIFGLRWTVESG